MSTEEILKTFNDSIGYIYEIVSVFFMKLSIPVAAYLGILTKLVMDLSSKKTTYLGAFIGMLVSVAVLYVSSPLLSIIAPSDEWFAILAFLLGTSALSIVKWINETDRVKLWLEHIEAAILEWIKNKITKK